MTQVGIDTLNRAWHHYTAAPTAGTFTVGEIVWNTNPAGGGPVGWCCVGAGSPGDWSAFGDLEAPPISAPADDVIRGRVFGRWLYSTTVAGDDLVRARIFADL